MTKKESEMEYRQKLKSFEDEIASLKQVISDKDHQIT